MPHPKQKFKNFENYSQNVTTYLNFLFQNYFTNRFLFQPRKSAERNEGDEAEKLDKSF